MKDRISNRKLKKHTRNREQTKQDLVDAVRSISLIYTYFGKLEGLLVACYFRHDYWLAYDQDMDKLIRIHQENFCRELAVIVIKRLFNRLMKDPFLQRIVQLEVTEHDELLRKLDAARERMWEKLFAVAEPYFKHTSVDIHSVIALLTAAVGHYVHKPGPYCMVDLRLERHQERLLETIRQFVCWAFEQAARDQAALTDVSVFLGWSCVF